jgi:hypothetical protein
MLAFVTVGLVSGAAMGMLGAGGSIMLMVLLLMIGMSMPEAIAISLLLQLVPLTLPAVWLYYSRGHLHHVGHPGRDRRHRRWQLVGQRDLGAHAGIRAGRVDAAGDVLHVLQVRHQQRMTCREQDDHKPAPNPGAAVQQTRLKMRPTSATASALCRGGLRATPSRRLQNSALQNSATTSGRVVRDAKSSAEFCSATASALDRGGLRATPSRLQNSALQNSATASALDRGRVARDAKMSPAEFCNSVSTRSGRVATQTPLYSKHN